MEEALSCTHPGKTLRVKTQHWEKTTNKPQTKLTQPKCYILQT